MNREFIDKMKEAKKMEAEAFMMILPENMRGHVEVIQKEVKAMLLEGLTECVMGKSKEEDCDKANSKVHKVEID